MEITLDMATAEATLQALPGGMRSHLVDRFRGLGQRMEHTLKGQLLAGEVLSRRTGTGQRSIFYEVMDDQAENAVTLRVGANLRVAPYMRILAYGGVIRPKKAKFLAIPMAAALTGAGVARFAPRDVIADPQAHGFEGTFFANQILFGIPPGGRARRDQMGPRAVPLFALRTQVHIPQNNYLAILMDRHYHDIRETAGGAARLAVETARPRGGPA